MEYEGIDIGDWEYEGPKNFVTKLIDAFGAPKYIEKDPTTNEAYSVTFMNIDGFDLVRVVDSNTNKLHPYPAKIYVEGSLYFTVPKNMVGPLKAASPTIMIDELNQLVTGKCASLTIAAATVQFVIDAVNGMAPATREEYDRRLRRIIDDNVLDPQISWWEDNLNEMKQEEKSFKEEKMIEKDGHTDVASSRRMCRMIMEDVTDIVKTLPEDGEASLPTWWTNKLAVSSAYLNSARDYLLYSSEGTEKAPSPLQLVVDFDSDKSLEEVQSEELEVEILKDVMDLDNQVSYGEYTTRHFDMCPTAVELYSEIDDKTEMVHLVVESMMLQDMLFKIEKQVIAMDAADADTVQKAQHYADMIMELAQQMNLVDEHSYIEDVHMAKIKEIASKED